VLSHEFMRRPLCLLPHAAKRARTEQPDVEAPAPKAQAVSEEADLVDEDATAGVLPNAVAVEPSKEPLTLSVPDADAAPAGTPTPTLHASSAPAVA